MGLRWTEYALQSYSNVLLGLTLIIFGMAIAYGSGMFPRARMARCGLRGRLHHPRPDGFLRGPVRLSAPAGGTGSHGRLGVRHGFLNVASGSRGRAACAAAQADPVTA